VTSTNDFISNIKNQVQKEFNGKLLEPKNTTLILKADGMREYFEGNY